MFYDKNQVDSHLNCKSCQKRFDLPRLLTCGEVICETCLNNIKNAGGITNEIKCPFCSVTHSGVFPVQRALMSLLKLQASNKPFRGVLIEELDDTTSNLNKRLNSLKIYQEAASMQMDTRKAELRKKIAESAEKKRGELYRLEESLKLKIDVCEKEVFERLKSLLDKFVQENESSVTLWTQLIDDNDNLENDDKLVAAINDVGNLMDEVGTQKRVIKTLVDSLEIVEFNESEEKIGEVAIGRLKTTTSNIIDDTEEVSVSKQDANINCKTQ